MTAPLTTTELRDFIQGAVPTPLGFRGPDEPDVPDRYWLVTRAEGSNPTFDGLFRRQGFELRSIGRQDVTDDPSDAEDLAAVLDELVLAINGIRIAGKYVLRVQHAGGEPAPIPQDDADRVHFTCTYLFEVEA